MAKGDTQKTIDISDQMRQQAAQNAQATLANSQGLTNTAAAGYNKMLATPGYSQGQQNATTSATMGAVNSAYDAANNKAQLTANRTNNSASLNDTMDDMARQKAQASAGQAAQNQIQFGNAARQDTQSALQGLSSLNSQQNQLYSTQMNNQQSDLDQRAQLTPNRPSFWSQLPGQLIQGGATVGAAVLGGKG